MTVKNKRSLGKKFVYGPNTDAIKNGNAKSEFT